ncbi:hypothetical protein QQ008_29180 [Fulvivirgaceae bacterium BMA10]|uniref:Nudix hydrolase domain-containing protein n=1 Tax=Splendidivirga corallicola TaxID=3051826 RepID=A0ABT8KXG9_9BACT|nr:hypothetical protein [Fulvivirgaceae bacterium BMA10]
MKTINHCLLCLILIFLPLISIPIYLNAQNKAGTILYYLTEEDIFLLLAHHKVLEKDEEHGARGWAGFGGDKLSNETLTQTAIRETYQETRGAYIKDSLSAKLSEDFTVTLANGFKVYFVKTYKIPAFILDTFPLLSDSSEYKERGPYVWVKLSILYDFIENSKKDIISIKGHPDFKSTSDRAEWLYSEFTELLRTIKKDSIQKYFDIPEESKIFDKFKIEEETEAAEEEEMKAAAEEEKGEEKEDQLMPFSKGQFKFDGMWWELVFNRSNNKFYPFNIQINRVYPSREEVGNIELHNLEADKKQFNEIIVTLEGLNDPDKKLDLINATESVYLQAVAFKNSPKDFSPVAGHIEVKKRVSSFAIPLPKVFREQKKIARFNFSEGKKNIKSSTSIDEKNLKKLHRITCLDNKLKELLKEVDLVDKNKFLEPFEEGSMDHFKYGKYYQELETFLKYKCFNDDWGIVNHRSVDSDSLVEMMVKSDEEKSKLKNILSYYKSYYSHKQFSVNYNRILKNPLNRYKKTLYVDSAEIEFSDGIIKNIILVGNLLDDTTRTKRIYHNYTPISFSDISDFKRLHKESLVAFHEGTEYRFMIKLSDLIAYTPKLHLYSEDYSPKDTVVMLNPHRPPAEVKLQKERSNRLFEARIYSDFIGLQEENANGLIQTEISKKIILVPGRAHIPMIRDFKRRFFFGGFNYIKPHVAFTKIEDNNRILDLKINATGDSLIRNVIVDSTFQRLQGDSTLIRVDTTFERTEKRSKVEGLATTLDLIRNANFNAGGTLNVLVLDWRRIKSSFYLNFGFDYYRTKVRDSSAFINSFRNPEVSITTSNTNIFTYSAEGVWEIKPDPRYGFFLKYRISWIDVRTESMRRVNSLENLTEKPDKRYFSLHFSLTFRPSQDEDNRNKLFFRGTYTSLFGRENDRDFFQAQVGYSFFLLKK